MKIQRNHPNSLSFSHNRHRGTGWFFGLWTFSMVGILLVTVYFNDVQSSAMQLIYGTATPTTAAVTYATQAQAAFQLGKLEEAIRLYQLAAEMEPDNLNIQFEYVRSLIYQSFAGRKFAYLQQDALAVAEAAAQRYPSDPRSQAMLTLTLTQAGRSEEAIAAGIRTIEAAPQWAEGHAYLSMAYRDQGRFRQAIESGERAVQLNPNSVDSKRAMALSMAFVGEFDLAIQAYNDAIRIAPRMDALYFELAVYYLAQDRYDAAVAAYDQVLANNPSNAKAYTRKCEAYFRQRDDARAQEACDQAVQLDPDFPEAHRQLGMVRYTRRNYEGAIESFQRCSDLTPMGQQGEIECWYLRGLAWYLLDECDESVPVLQEALAMNPSEGIQTQIYIGLSYCASYDPNYDSSIIPTPIPPTPIPPEPIGIY